jgi:hypothetical protein
MSALAATLPSGQTTLRLQPAIELDVSDCEFLKALWTKVLPHVAQCSQGATPTVLQTAITCLKPASPWLVEQLLTPARLKHLPYLWQHLGWLACVESATPPKQSYWLPTPKGWCVAQQSVCALNILHLPTALAVLTPQPTKATVPTQPSITFSSKSQQRLYHALQACRAMLAQRQGVDPTQLCSHKVLLAMVQAHPITEPALAALDGVDATFIQQYAPAFLDTLIPLALCP